MATNFLWAVGTGGYASGTPTSLLTTELNTLANSSGNTLSTLGSAFDNSSSSSFIYADVEFLAGGTYTPLAGGFIELWLLRSIDNGSNYEDGSSSAAPGRPADIIIPVRAGTTITPRAIAPGLILPPGKYKPIARNQTGASLPASGNTIRIGLYTEAY